MSRSRSLSVFFALSAAALLVQPIPAAPGQGGGQSKPAGEAVQKQGGDFTLSVDVQLVTLPVSVVDKDGLIVPNLAKEHFQVFEDKVLQDISLFKHEDVPISVGLVIDNSGSMRNKRERVNSAALTFVRESNPEDETFIINFDDEAYLEQDFTSSIGDLIDALDNIDARGETALNDAVYLGVDHLEKGRMDKKVLLVISDGEDSKSKYGFNKVLEHVKAAKDVAVYAIGLLELDDQRGGLFRSSPSKKAKEALTKLTEATGGQAYFPKTIEEVEDICKRIAHDLRNQYTLGYAPKKKMDGTWREIQVKVNPPKNTPKLTVRYKQGYMATPKK